MAFWQVCKHQDVLMIQQTFLIDSDIVMTFRVSSIRAFLAFEAHVRCTDPDLLKIMQCLMFIQNVTFRKLFRSLNMLRTIATLG